uniref:Uncharacterized protein MANES_05G024400 n=1 Tax=Rhizophora mucronata TaxID=61149 RepID=A0A2P2K6R6_RHIMU
MDKQAPFYRHHLNPPPHQNPAAHKPKPRTPHSPNHLSLASAATTAPLSTPPLSPWPHNLPDFPVLNGSSGDFRTLGSVRAMHAQIIKTRDKWNSDSVAETLINSYLEHDDFKSAAMVFLVGFVRNYVFWNTFLEEFERFGGDTTQILKVFRDLHHKGVIFDSQVVTIVLKICTSVMELWLGLEVHASLIKRGFESDTFVKCALMNFYGRHWGAESANQVFHEMPQRRDDILWNEAIVINLRNERWATALGLFRGMQFAFATANAATILKLLQACGKEGALEEGKQIHGYVLRQALESNLSICNSLIVMYSRNDKLKLAGRVFDSMEEHNLSSWNSIVSSCAALGYLDEAWDLFHKMESCSVKPDIVTWNCLLSGLALHGLYKEVLTTLQRMQVAGFRPNSISATSVLQAVIELRLFNAGKEIHGFVLRNELDHDVYVGTSLLDMYIKNDCLTRSKAIFDNMKNKNIVAWNALISGYSFKGLLDDARRLLNQMEEEGVKLDLVTWNSLISGYSMWNHTTEALDMLHKIKSSGLTPDVVSWTALISGCSQSGKFRESLEFFIQMQQEGIKPNSATISSVLRTCGGLSLLQKGKEIHCLSIRKGFNEDAYVVTALIDMYSKSGALKNAHEVFRKCENQTLASWNCMIMGFAIYSLGKKVMSLFNEMLKAGFLPDAITFTALLSGCKNSALVDEGWKYFDSMSKEYGIEPTIEHYSCMVDLLGRAGYIDEAWDFIQAMPLAPDASIWGALLASCCLHRHMEFAEIAAKELFQLEPHNSANYVLMMNLYAVSDRWVDIEHIRDLMAAKGVKNGQVWSWVQIDNTVHVFSAEKKPNKDDGEVYFELFQLVSEMKKLGYVPDVNCVYQNVDELEKEKALLSHTEKLAMTYGLIRTRNSTPIRVIKNTRICSDCHTAAKFMSLVHSREIFLRDGVRFHHFKAGKCSCNDHW